MTCGVVVEAMEQNGIGLGSASVSDGFSRQMNQQAQQDSSGSSRSGSSGSRSGGTLGTAASDDDLSTSTASVTQRTVGLIDTFA